MENSDNLRPILEKKNWGRPGKRFTIVYGTRHGSGTGLQQTDVLDSVPIMPTPGAVGICMQTAAKEYDMSVIGADIGERQSMFFPYSANTLTGLYRLTWYGYSICNVLLEAGIDSIKRWVPFNIDESDLRNRIRNKMIRPTTIPQTLDGLSSNRPLPGKHSDWLLNIIKALVGLGS